MFAHRLRIVGRLVVPLGLVCLVACSEPMAPEWNDADRVSGTVQAIVDDTPVDGGIRITVKPSGGETRVLLVPSLFRPGVTDADIALVEKARRARVGTTIWARGTPSAAGLQVRDLYLTAEEARDAG